MQIGIDLGGTKIEAIALTAETVVAPRRRVPSPRDYDGTLDAIARLVAELEAETGRSGSVGVGIPGVVTRATGRVKNANSVWLNGRPLQADLEARLGRPVRLANDANCFALSEAIDGAGQGVDTVFGVILGTGVGGGISVGRRILDGPNQVAGEWGHNPLPWMTDEERRRGAALLLRQRRAAWRPGSRVPASSVTPPVSRDGAVRPRRGARRRGRRRPARSEALRRYEDRLARGLASVINLLDPGAIVLGGGMSNLPGLAGAVAALLPEYVFSDAVLTRVVPQPPRRLQRSARSGVAVALKRPRINRWTGSSAVCCWPWWSRPSSPSGSGIAGVEARLGRWAEAEVERRTDGAYRLA